MSDIKKIFIFGNGNISFDDFLHFYVHPIKVVTSSSFDDSEFLLCDFRGTDILAIELLKNISPKVTIFHMNTISRYFPDSYKTKASSWKIKGGYLSDLERDTAAINECTHFLAKDFNSDDKRKSGTQKNIKLCLSLGKIPLL